MLFRSKLEWFDSKSLDNRIISDSRKIDQILCREPQNIFAISFFPQPALDTQIELTGIRIYQASNFKKFKPELGRLKKTLVWGTELKLTLDYYRPKIGERVGVYARFGNGEILDKGRVENPCRMEDFFDAMDKESGGFFICTDSPRFLALCQQRYPQRVYHTDRYLFLEGCGAGHVLIEGLSDFNREILEARRKEIGPYRQIHDALRDMALLASCKKLL